VSVAEAVFDVDLVVFADHLTTSDGRWACAAKLGHSSRRNAAIISRLACFMGEHLELSDVEFRTTGHHFEASSSEKPAPPSTAPALENTGYP